MFNIIKLFFFIYLFIKREIEYNELTDTLCILKTMKYMYILLFYWLKKYKFINYLWTKK